MHLLLLVLHSLLALDGPPLTAIENCYSTNLGLSVDCNRNMLCFSLVPDNKYECSLLPDTVLLTINLSSYTTPLQKIIMDFKSTETSNLCVQCPSTDQTKYTQCKDALRLATSVSISIASKTHQVVLSARSLLSTNLNLTRCYSPNSTVYIKTGAGETNPALCVTIESTGACSILDNPSIGQFVSAFLYIYSGSKSFKYQLESGFTTSKVEVCNAKTHESTDLTSRLLEDEWSYGVFELNFNLNTYPYRSTTQLFTVMFGKNANCLGLSELSIYPNHLVVFVEGKNKPEDCTIDSIEFSSIQLTAYLYSQTNTSVKFRNNITVEEYNSTRSYYFHIPCKDTSLCMQAYTALLNAMPASSVDLYTGSFKLRYEAGNGSVTDVVNSYVSVLRAPCWVDSRILVYKGTFAVFMSPSGARSCPITTQQYNYTIRATIRRTREDNPTWKDEEVLAVFQVKKEFNINITSITFTCANELYASPSRTQSDCETFINQLYSKRASRSVELNYVGRDLFLNEVASVRTIVKSFRNFNYSRTNLITSIFALVMALGYLGIVIAMFVMLHRNMGALMKTMEERF